MHRLFDRRFSHIARQAAWFNSSSPTDQRSLRTGCPVSFLTAHQPCWQSCRPRFLVECVLYPSPSTWVPWLSWEAPPAKPRPHPSPDVKVPGLARARGRRRPLPEALGTVPAWPWRQLQPQAPRLPLQCTLPHLQKLAAAPPAGSPLVLSSAAPLLAASRRCSAPCLHPQTHTPAARSTCRTPSTGTSSARVQPCSTGSTACRARCGRGPARRPLPAFCALQQPAPAAPLLPLGPPPPPHPTWPGALTPSCPAAPPSPPHARWPRGTHWGQCHPSPGVQPLAPNRERWGRPPPPFPGSCSPQQSSSPG